MTIVIIQEGVMQIIFWDLTCPIQAFAIVFSKNSFHVRPTFKVKKNYQLWPFCQCLYHFFLTYKTFFSSKVSDTASSVKTSVDGFSQKVRTVKNFSKLKLKFLQNYRLDFFNVTVDVCLLVECYSTVQYCVWFLRMETWSAEVVKNLCMNHLAKDFQFLSK